MKPSSSRWVWSIATSAHPPASVRRAKIAAMLPRTRSRTRPPPPRLLRLALGRGRRLGLDGLRARAVGLVAALIQAERRVSVGHQADVHRHARDPAVQPEDEREDAGRVPVGEEEREAGDHHEQPDEPGVEARAPLVGVRRDVRTAAEQDPEDEVVGDREEPPLDEHEAARQLLRVLDREPRGVVRDVVQRERRVPVGAEGAVRVEGDTPRPPEHADVEVEDPARIAARDEDREERDHGQQEEREPEEGQQDVVRDRQCPLDDPEPAAQLGVAAPFDPDGVGPFLGGRRAFHAPTVTRCGATRAAPARRRSRTGRGR